MGGHQGPWVKWWGGEQTCNWSVTKEAKNLYWVKGVTTQRGMFCHESGWYNNTYNYIGETGVDPVEQRDYDSVKGGKDRNASQSTPLLSSPRIKQLHSNAVPGVEADCEGKREQEFNLSWGGGVNK